MNKGLEIFDLSGKTALITGSSQGIGFTLAQGLSDAGASIVLNGRDTAKLSDAANRLRSGGANVFESPFDVTDHGATASAVNEIESDFAPVDILINNAGMQHRTPLHEFDPDKFEELMRTNVSSVFNVGQAVAKKMIARGSGKIINIASVQTALARPGIAPYTASKGAVGNLTKGMATDWAQYGLNVNAIAPGYFDTPLNAALVSDAEFTKWVNTRTPSGRWGQLDELVGASIFLSSAASSFVNGHVLFIDGGMSVCL